MRHVLLWMRALFDVFWTVEQKHPPTSGVADGYAGHALKGGPTCWGAPAITSPCWGASKDKDHVSTIARDIVKGIKYWQY